MTRLWATGEPVQVVVAPSGAHDKAVGATLVSTLKACDVAPDAVTPSADVPGAVPVRFQLRGEWYEVAFIANRWRVHTTWWRPEAGAQREYFKLATVGGLLCVLYHDLQSQAWYCARVYD